MKKLLIVSVLMLMASLPLIAQKTDDKAAALAVVNQLFDEMAAANAAGILATGTPENQLVAIRKLRDGKNASRCDRRRGVYKIFYNTGGDQRVNVCSQS